MAKSKVKRGRPPINGKAMTNAERQSNYRARRAAELAELRRIVNKEDDEEDELQRAHGRQMGRAAARAWAREFPNRDYDKWSTCAATDRQAAFHSKWSDGFRDRYFANLKRYPDSKAYQEYLDSKKGD